MYMYMFVMLVLYKDFFSRSLFYARQGRRKQKKVSEARNILVAPLKTEGRKQFAQRTAYAKLFPVAHKQLGCGGRCKPPTRGSGRSPGSYGILDNLGLSDAFSGWYNSMFYLF